MNYLVSSWKCRRTAGGLSRAIVVSLIPKSFGFTGVPGQLGHPLVFEAAKKIIAAARRTKKTVAVGASPSEIAFYAEAGVDLLYFGNDIACLRTGIHSALQHAPTAVTKAQAR